MYFTRPWMRRPNRPTPDDLVSHRPVYIWIWTGRMCVAAGAVLARWVS